MTVAEMIKRALVQHGFPNIKQAAVALGVSRELLRVTITLGHIPKDAVLGKIAYGLGLDRGELVLAAHQEKVPVEVKGYFLNPAKRRSWQEKRVWPLSDDQCDYLSKVLNDTEIQILRKLRQISDHQARVQIAGYVDYTWETKRKTMNVGADEEKKKETGIDPAAGQVEGHESGYLNVSD